MALAFAVRDRLLDGWLLAQDHLGDADVRIVGYLSAEFLMGPHLGNNLVNLGIVAPTREAVTGLGLDLDRLLSQEEEPGLGNGGLGRLAACYLDSLATLRVPGDRLRHPLRVRHLRPGDPRRLAGRDHRQVAAPRAIRGRSGGRRSPSASVSGAAANTPATRPAACA